MLVKLTAFWRLFRAGEEVADPRKWKNRAMAVNAVVALLAAAAFVLKQFGIDLGISDTDMQAIAGAAFAIFNIVLHVTTSKKVGLPPVGEAADGREDGTESTAFPEDNAGD